MKSPERRLCAEHGMQDVSMGSLGPMDRRMLCMPSHRLAYLLPRTKATMMNNAVAISSRKDLSMSWSFAIRRRETLLIR